MIGGRYLFYFICKMEDAYSKFLSQLENLRRVEANKEKELFELQNRIHRKQEELEYCRKSLYLTITFNLFYDLVKNEKFIEVLHQEKSIVNQNTTLELKIVCIQKDNFFISKGNRSIHYCLGIRSLIR